MPPFGNEPLIDHTQDPDQPKTLPHRLECCKRDSQRQPVTVCKTIQRCLSGLVNSHPVREQAYVNQTDCRDPSRRSTVRSKPFLFAN